MKIFQKLEMFAGLATLIAASLSIYFIVLPEMERLEELKIANKDMLPQALLALLLPAFLLTVGVYIHIAKRSIIGFIIVLIFGGLLTLSHAIGFLAGTSFFGHPLLGISTGLFAAITVFFAFCTTLLAASQDDAVELH